MKKCIFAVVAIIMLLGAHAYAQKPVVVIGPGMNSGRTPYHQDYDKVLSSDTVYTLTGLYYVDSTYSMTIPPGTVIRGDTAATLIISRGAKIYAEGNEHQPIVFTSLKDPNFRQPGDWGGVILLGQAPVNKVEPQIEGGIIGGSFGGSDPDDTTGVFCYVRIEFPGYRFQLNNEVNGLTMGGIGRGTELHHVQVSYSFDDSFEWFGGTVNAHHLVTMGGTDDEFDTDFGYQGKIQFCFGLRDRLYWDPTGQSNGFESDNDGSSTSTAEPYTNPLFCNVTLVGPQFDALTPPPPGHTYQYSAVIRRSTKCSVYNSVIVGYPWGVSNRDTYTHMFSMNGELQWQNVSVGASYLKTATSIHGDDRWAPDSCTLWFDTSAYANYASDSVRYCADVGLVNMTNLNNPNPVPAIGSELDGTADFSNPKLADFEEVTYRGAFDPNVPIYHQWIREWTNFNPKTTEYNPIQTGEDVPQLAVGMLSQNFPNPFNPITTIRYSVPRTGHVSLVVYSVRGERISTLVNGEKEAGSYEVSFNANGLASGTYFYTFKGEGFQETRKMVILR